MYLPKIDVKNILSALDYQVEQNNPVVFDALPVITFKVSDNSVDMDLDGEIRQQDIEIGIDIWSESSVESSQILSAVELAMRANEYKMTFSSDIPNIDKVFHISSRFKKII